MCAFSSGQQSLASQLVSERVGAATRQFHYYIYFLCPLPLPLSLSLSLSLSLTEREQVYIANIVKCRPPANRVPEPVEANTCSQFLLRQMDVIQPRVVVALGSTAATYLLGVKQSLSSLRGRWHSVRGAKLLVTYHPAFLLRDPRQKGEAWADLQMAMKELGLKAPARS